MIAAQPGSLLVVGSANADLVANVDRFPTHGETVVGLGYDVYPGGKGANQAVAAARIGARAAFIGCLGDDRHAELLRKSLDSAGVITSDIQVDPDQPTGTAIIVVDGSGQNQIVVIPGANHSLDGAGIPIEDLASSGTGTMLIQLEIPTKTVNACLLRAKAAGMTTILNPAPSNTYQYLEWAAVDVAIPNESEAHELRPVAGTMGFSGTTIVTRGKDGFELLVPNCQPRTGEAPVVAAVDTTGAGDCFCGVVAAFWNQTDDKHGVCEFAMMAASLSVMRRGAQPSMPTCDEVAAFIANL